MNEFENKVVIITGATSGIGRATAIEFAKNNAILVLVGRDKEKGSSLISELSIYNNICEFYQLDITDEKNVKKFAEYIEEKYNRVDVLFNNAGSYPKFNTLELLEKKDWDDVFITNTSGLVSVTRNFINLLIKSRGCIINNASVAGMQNFASGQGYAYAASKSAVIQFTKMTAKIYADKVRINCICPGIIDTPLYFSLNKEKMAERIPSKKVGYPEDVANVVVFLASEKASYIYGALIPIDGGLTL